METINTFDQYARDGEIRAILRRSRIDFTGDRITESGELVPESPAEAALRLAGYIHPDEYARLRNLGVEV